MATDDDGKGKVLTTLARNAIAGEFGLPPRPVAQPPWLDAEGAVFVTLTQHGGLRGCIGSCAARRPLRDDVTGNARAAAFLDPRFAPLTPDELADTNVEVSVLSKPIPLVFTDEADALGQLRPGVDGVILEYGLHRATFLPQVWEQLPEPGTFLAQLKLKAGLPADFWAEGVKLSRYTVEKYKEAEP